MKKLIFFGLFIVLSVFVSAQSYWVKDPTNCPGSYAGVGCTSPQQVCGYRPPSQCYDTSLISIPSSYNSNYQTQVSSGLAAGYVLNCYAIDGSNPPYCDKWKCQVNSTCESQVRITNCTSTTATTCSDCKSSYLNCTGDDVCEIRIGESCTTYSGSLNGTCQACGTTGYDSNSNNCSCNPLPINFQTGVLANYFTSNPLLWGYQASDGWLLNFSFIEGSVNKTFGINGSGCIVFPDNTTQCSGADTNSCPTDMIWVPGSAKHGTLPGFCVDKYESSTGGFHNIAYLRTFCDVKNNGTFPDDHPYHLISDEEWMSIADNIFSTKINSMDPYVYKFATGHSDNSPATWLSQPPAGADPDISGCNLTRPMSDTQNNYADDCQIRGNTTNTALTDSRGYYGTGNYWGQSYFAGASGRSQMRTYVLSNGEIIWDFAGNFDEITDFVLYYDGSNSEQPSASSISGCTAREFYYNRTAFSILDFRGIQWVKPPFMLENYTGLYSGIGVPANGLIDSSNGIGTLRLQSAAPANNYLVFSRGGNFSSGSSSGLYSLNFCNDALTTVVGTAARYRCAK